MKHYSLIVLFSFFINLQPHFLYAAHGSSDPLAQEISLEKLNPETQAALREAFGLSPDQNLEEFLIEQDKRGAQIKAASKPCTLSDAQKRTMEQALQVLKQARPLYHPIVRQVIAYLIKMLFGINAKVIFHSRFDGFDDLFGTKPAAARINNITMIQLAQFTPQQAGLLFYFSHLLTQINQTLEQIPYYLLENIQEPLEQNINELLDCVRTSAHRPENKPLGSYLRYAAGNVKIQIIQKAGQFNYACYPPHEEIDQFIDNTLTRSTLPEQLRNAITELFTYFLGLAAAHPKPADSPEVFTQNRAVRRWSMSQWFASFYTDLHRVLAHIEQQKKRGETYKPLLIEFNKDKFQIPNSLNGTLIPYPPTPAAQRATGSNDTWSVQKALADLGEDEAPKKPSKTKAKGAKSGPLDDDQVRALDPKKFDSFDKALQKQIVQAWEAWLEEGNDVPPAWQAVFEARDIDLFATPQDIEEEEGAPAQQITPPTFVHKDIRPGYTQTAKLWLENPDTVIAQYGYLNENPTTQDQKVHRKIFQEMLTQYGQKARSMLIANHTVPTIVDEYMLDFEPRSYDDNFFVSAPLYRLNADGTTDEGMYELIYKKNKDRKITIFHKLFRPMNHEQFIAAAFSGRQTQPFQIDSVPSEEDWQDAWHPVSGQWNVEIKQPYYVAFSRPGTQESYYLLKHPLIMPVQE